MKKILSLAACVLIATALFAQENPETTKPESSKTKINLSNRANDHLLVQFGYAGWLNAPDSAKPEGFSKSFNVYFMFDFPFKTNPRLSMAFGPGVATDHIIFKEKYVGIKDLTARMPCSGADWF